MAVLFLVAAVALLWLGSADAPIDTRNSAFWYRTLRNVPGLTDVCGDFTWLARGIPTVLLGAAFIGAASIDRGAARWVLLVAGLLVAVGLWFAATQNAVPLGEQHCILD